MALFTLLCLHVKASRLFFSLSFHPLFVKQIVNIVEGPKLINRIFMRVYVCMMYVLDTFTGSS